jgi:hypothetical protein
MKFPIQSFLMYLVLFTNVLFANNNEDVNKSFNFEYVTHVQIPYGSCGDRQ